ncbi:hypothetical protein IFR05_007253 [Cadophora sp. M221]|nr:hypothetical protein IFR05_007253 [Cadophora sp. M221]
MVPPIRVLLDVGAQLLDDNERIASDWLEKVSPEDAQAVVYFHENDLFVLNREACKRLRKLGNGQSVVFCAPLEVQPKILECSEKKNASLLDVEDVLLWTMRNSWEFTKKGMPLSQLTLIPKSLRGIHTNFTRGIRHYRRRAACDYSGDVPHIPLGILEPEALTLDERYGLDKQHPDEGIVCRNRIRADSDLTRAELSSIRNKCREFGLQSFGDSDLHEEQERELHPENEREHLTRARGKLNPDDWPKTFLMSHDFSTTVKIPEAFDEGNKDSFLRPVNWVLSFKGPTHEPTYLILSPYEVQELLPQMRGQDRVRLHVYSPRFSLSNHTIEDLLFCAVPPVRDDWTCPEISTILNLFAGQLYLRSEDEYHRLCRFLGIRFKYPYRGAEISTDGFIFPETRILQDDVTATAYKFAQSPIDFLRLVTAFRRLGQTFTNSHMGKILSGELVMSMDFDEDSGIRERVEEVDDDLMC